MMRDEVLIRQMCKRAEIEKMDTAFCAAMLSAIDAGTEHSPEGVWKEPGTRRPIVFLAINTLLACGAPALPRVPRLWTAINLWTAVAATPADEQNQP